MTSAVANVHHSCRRRPPPPRPPLPRRRADRDPARRARRVRVRPAGLVVVDLGHVRRRHRHGADHDRGADDDHDRAAHDDHHGATGPGRRLAAAAGRQHPVRARRLRHPRRRDHRASGARRLGRDLRRQGEPSHRPGHRASSRVGVGRWAGCWSCTSAPTGAAATTGRRPIGSSASLVGVERVVWVTCTPWLPAVGDADERHPRAARPRHPEVVVADWAAVSGTPGYTYSDGLHLKPAGATGLAWLIADAVGPAPAPAERVRGRRGAAGTLLRRVRTDLDAQNRAVQGARRHPRRPAAGVGPLGGADRRLRRSTSGAAGYGLVQSPMFEEIGVFRRMGEGTDVVRKEMYDFLDKGERHLALRPEGTASVVRAFVQHRPTTPWKVWYAAPSFRYERPQAGRYRQHHQLGVEAIGSDRPRPRRRGHRPAAATSTGRIGLRQVELRHQLDGHRRPTAPPTSSGSARFLVGTHRRARPRPTRRRSRPTRCGCSTPSARPPAPPSPTPRRIIDRLSRRGVGPLRAGAGRASPPLGHRRSAIEPRLVRGLDYYTHTTFEFQSAAPSTRPRTRSAAAVATTAWSSRSAARRRRASASARASSGCCSPATPRACSPRPSARSTSSSSTSPAATAPATSPSSCAGPASRADRAFDGRSMKSQMKSADRSGAAPRRSSSASDELAAGTVTVRDLRGDAGQQTRRPRRRRRHRARPCSSTSSPADRRPTPGRRPSTRPTAPRTPP